MPSPAPTHTQPHTRAPLALTPFGVPSPALRRADRLLALPPFLFNEIDNKKKAAIAAGKDVINLGVGDPDRPTPGFIVDELARAAHNPATHRYPDCYGTPRFLESAARFLHDRFGVKADPARHLLATIGGKDGIAHLPLGVLNPGDASIVFAPAYPVYAAATILAGGRVHRFETSESTRWLPDWSDPALHACARDERTRLLWLNFPNNPTGASAGATTFEQAARLARAHNLILASDLAYSEIYFDSPASAASMWPAVHSLGGTLDSFHGIEFHSLSKTFNMTGWRLGFAVGHPDVIGALKQVKDNVDSGVFNAIQDAGSVALDRYRDPALADMRTEYLRRRNLVVAGLRAIGCEVVEPHAGIFVWARCPLDGRTGKPMDSWAFVARLIDEAAVVTVPGAGFADTATDWVRVSLTRETHRIEEAMRRLQAIAW